MATLLFVTPLQAKGQVLLQDACASGQFQLPLHRIEQQKPEESERLVLLEGGSCAFLMSYVPFRLYSAICSSEDPNRSGWHQNIQGSKMPPLQEQKLYGSNPNAQTQRPWEKRKTSKHLIPCHSCDSWCFMQPRLSSTYPHAPNMSQFLWAQVPIGPTTLALFHQPQLYTPSLTAFALSSLSAASSKQVEWERWRGAFCFWVFSYIAEVKE